jgi:cellulose synthase/poly-beta-1,6-N-acetylglucosamine synthase-like glycosyltransferase
MAASLFILIFSKLFIKNGLLISTLAAILTVMIAGELIPKGLANMVPEKAAIICAPPMRLFMKICWPVNLLLANVKKVVYKVFKAEEQPSLYEDELRTMLDEVAKNAGAYIFERFNKHLIGKGYALDYAFKNILNLNKGYEAYFVFDADNLLDENYVGEMNKVFDNGYKIITSYRNSKNYDTNWLSAGYSLWFLREAKYLNNPRMILNTGCAISGTGFLVSDDIIRKNKGWKHHLLTEDIEFTIDNAIRGEKIGYCGNAVVYDEQPYKFKQSWNQRLRWAKGFYQVFAKYGLDLIKAIFTKKSFYCYDMFVTIMPALFLTLVSVAVNLAVFLAGLISIDTYPWLMEETLGAILLSVLNSYMVLFVLGLITTVTEWKKINAPKVKKIKYMFSFPVFIFTYLPISIAALLKFKKIEWQPITHSIAKTIEELKF